MKRIGRKLPLIAACALPFAALAGCGGGSGGPAGLTSTPATSTTTNNEVSPRATFAPAPQSVNMVALSGNNLIAFNSSTPGQVTSRPITGLVSGDRIVGLDYRFAPMAAGTGTSNGTSALYALGRNGNRAGRLYTIQFMGDTSVVATPVGSTLSQPLFGTSFGFDFNPVPDRIRVVSNSSLNLRLNPDTGAVVDADMNATNGVTQDGTLTYAQGDSGQGTRPNIVGAAYTNNDTDTTTGTINYAIDSTRGVLVTQGRPDNPATTDINESVSPNTGQLFTVGSLGVKLTMATGFDISTQSGTGGNTNTAFLAIQPPGGAPRLCSVNLSTGRATQIGFIGGGMAISGLAVVPTVGTL